MKILSLGELERVARLFVREKPNSSFAPIIALIELSMTDTWVALNKISKKHGLNTDVRTLYPLLVEFDLAELRKVKIENSALELIEMKISPDLHCDDNEYNARIMNEMLSIFVDVLISNSSVSCNAVLFLLAVKVRKIMDSKEISQFMSVGNIGNARNNCSRMIDVFSNAGIIQAVKTDDYRKAPVMIFEVEQ